MKRQINWLGLIGGLGVIAWGIFLILITESNIPKVWYGPGIFGPHAPTVGGYVLLGIGVTGVLGSLVNYLSPFAASIFLLLASMVLTVSNFVTLISPYVLLNFVLTGIFYFAFWSSNRASVKK